jgi:hypothetical protein
VTKHVRRNNPETQLFTVNKTDFPVDERTGFVIKFELLGISAFVGFVHGSDF